jgi:Xaa-Pro aminopeptidase
MERRVAALEAAMAARDVKHALVYAANRVGSAIGWLTRWPVTREALVLYTPGERAVLLVNFYNHVPNAERMAAEADVRWAGENPIETATDELRRRGAMGTRIGTIGPIDHRAHAALSTLAEPVDMNRDYTRLRLVKSDEEIEWVRVAAGMTDDAVRALHEHAAPGMSESELGNIVERAYVARGGTTHIHYFGATPMSEPSVCVPSHYDLVHGFVGGYLPPVLGTRSRRLTQVPEFTFASGMTVVVQPNVVTRDETAGVQTGALLLVTEDGAEPLHAYERGLLHAPRAS